jgi:sugar lactone lactonase YvrE
VTYNGSSTIRGVQSDGQSLSVSGSLTLTDTGRDSTINALTLGGTIGGAARLTLTGTSVWQDGGNFASAETVVLGELDLSAPGGPVLLDGDLTNEGTFDGETLGGGTIQLNANIQNVGDFITPDLSGGGRLHNSSDGTVTALCCHTIDSAFFNEGLLEIPAGTLSITGTFENFAGSELDLGVYVIGESGAATLEFTGADVAMLGADVTLVSDGSALTDESGQDAFRNLATIFPEGLLHLRSGATASTNAPLTNKGLLDVGESTTFTTAGDYAQDPAASLRVGIAGSPPSGRFGVLSVNGTASLDGSLDIDRDPAFTPADGDSYPVLPYADHSGAFASVSGADIPPDRAFNPNYQPTVMSLDVGPALTIETWAGDGTPGFSGDGGPAIAAQINQPRGIAADDTTNDIWFADSLNSRIRMVTFATQTITTFAGNGTAGFSGDNGPATLASLNQALGVARDSLGNIYIADTGNDRVRKVDLTGTITTIAGPAGLSVPTSIAIDPSDAVYVSDLGSDRILRIGAGGALTAVAGTGTAGYNGDGIPATTAQLNDPEQIAIDPDFELFIADQANNRVRLVDLVAGTIVTVAGTGIAGYNGDGIAATSAKLNNPRGVAVGSSGNFFIADTHNDRIREVDLSSGTITTFAGSGSHGYGGDDGPPGNASFSFPQAVAAGDFVFISDTENDRIRKVF